MSSMRKPWTLPFPVPGSQDFTIMRTSHTPVTNTEYLSIQRKPKDSDVIVMAEINRHIYMARVDPRVAISKVNPMCVDTIFSPRRTSQSCLSPEKSISSLWRGQMFSKNKKLKWPVLWFDVINILKSPVEQFFIITLFFTLLLLLTLYYY